MTLHYKGGQATFSIAIAAAKALTEQGDNESLKVFKFRKHWAQNLFRRMGLKKKCCNNRKRNYTRECTDLLVRYCQKIEIPHQLVFNMHQTPSKYIQSSRYTIEKSESKSVAIADSGEKLAITAMFIIDLSLIIKDQ